MILILPLVIATIVFPFWKDVLNLYVAHGFVFAYRCFIGRMRALY